MRPEMVRRHEIEIVYPPGKERLNFRKKLRRRDRAAFMLDRDLIILAEKTLTGTAAKEDSPGTLGPCKRGLFAEMRS